MEETIRVPIKDVGRISVDVNKFGHGMETMLSGMSAVWGSLGINFPPGDRPASEETEEVKKEKPKGSITPDAVLTDSSNDNNTPAETKEPKEQEPPQPQSISYEEITHVIVTKIKQNRKNSLAIQKLLENYSAKKVSELKPEQYEAFMTDLATI